MIAIALSVFAAPVRPSVAVEPPRAAVEIAQMSLESLVRRADVVVLARVNRIEVLKRPRAGTSETPSQPVGKYGFDDSWLRDTDVRVAEADVLRVLEGATSTTKVHFLARPTWTCDGSTAELGETALLFLSWSRWVEAESAEFKRTLDAFTGDAAMFDLTHSGCGRMPQRLVDGRAYISYATVGVAMPFALAIVAGPNPDDGDYVKSVALDDLAKLVTSHVRAQGAKVEASACVSGSSIDRWLVTVWEDGFRSRWKWPSLLEDRISIDRRASPWKALEGLRFTQWRDSGTIEQSVATLTITSNGTRRTIRLAPPSRLSRPLDPLVSEPIDAWVALAADVDDDAARETCSAYRALSTTPR